MHHTYTHSQCKQIRVLFIWLNIQATEETASSDMITLHSTGSGAYRSWDNREHSGGRKPLFNSQPCSAQVKKKKKWKKKISSQEHTKKNNIRTAASVRHLLIHKPTHRPADTWSRLGFNAKEAVEGGFWRAFFLKLNVCFWSMFCACCLGSHCR